MKKYIKDFATFINERFDFEKPDKNGLTYDESHELYTIIVDEFISALINHNNSYKNNLDDFLSFIDSNINKFMDNINMSDEDKENLFNWDHIKYAAKKDWKYITKQIENRTVPKSWEKNHSSAPVVSRKGKGKKVNLIKLCDFLNKTYEVLDDNRINYSEMEIGDEKSTFLIIPVTTNGSIIEPLQDSNNKDIIESIIASPDLVEFIDENVYNVQELEEEDIYSSPT